MDEILVPKRARLRKMKLIQALYIRDGRMCRYCGREMMTLPEIEGYVVVDGEKRPGNYPTLDHVIPKSAGGKTTLDNLVVACQTCNSKKGNRATYVSKHPVIRHSVPLGECPACHRNGNSIASYACELCRGAGILDDNRYYEVVDNLWRQNKSLRKKGQAQRRELRQLKEMLAEHGDEGQPRWLMQRQLDSLKNVVKFQRDRIRELTGGHEHEHGV